MDECRLRRMNCELNPLSRSDGSAILSQGGTVVVASVYGPVECKIQNSDIHKASVEVNFATRSGQTSVRERFREAVVRQTCESALLANLFPRDAIEINLQELEDRGGLMAVSLNACCLALVNAGLPMRFLFAAVNCAVGPSGEVLIDPTLAESSDARARITFVFDGADKNLIASSTEGRFSPQKYQECLIKCRRASESIFLYYRQIVTKYATAL